MTEFCIDSKDWKKIINYARAREQECGDEIGGMAIAKQDDDGDWIISEPTILKQETTGGTCTLDKDELAQFYADKAAKHGINIQFVWWHSHAKMAAFWSGTDTETMKEYKSGDWSMFLVVNVREEYKFRVQYWNPFEMGKDIELNILNDTKDYKVPKNVLKEVKETCNKPVSTGIIRRGYNWRNGQQSIFNKNSDEDDWIDAFACIMDGISNYMLPDEDITLEADPIEFLMFQIDEGNNKYCDGSIKYDKYKKTMTEFNTTLERLRSEGPKLSVMIYPKEVLMDTIMTSNPHDFIMIDGKPIAELYMLRKEEEQADFNAYNASYGIRRDVWNV